jgi:hypothetical protein
MKEYYETKVEASSVTVKEMAEAAVEEKELSEDELIQRFLETDTDIKGSLKKVIIIKRSGARDFSTGKSFSLGISGIQF